MILYNKNKYILIEATKKTVEKNYFRLEENKHFQCHNIIRANEQVTT